MESLKVPVEEGFPDALADFRLMESEAILLWTGIRWCCWLCESNFRTGLPLQAPPLAFVSPSLVDLDYSVIGVLLLLAFWVSFSAWSLWVFLCFCCFLLLFGGFCLYFVGILGGLVFLILALQCWVFILVASFLLVVLWLLFIHCSHLFSVSFLLCLLGLRPGCFWWFVLCLFGGRVSLPALFLEFVLSGRGCCFVD